ncbi:hypothetical protein F5Y14DRAFT_286586 [Nemania sp. NC0429]|nr:hypothetical protein F5Y14DRAFT_286586 [Nemania sp. NC0429]
MRPAILLLAASGCVHAAWLRWSVDREEVWPARETGHIAESNQIGWTPKPTPAPGVRSDNEAVLDLFRRKTSETDWTNSETCGWFSGVSSSAVTCGGDFTCKTNTDHVVGCVSGTISPFFTACLDYSAFKAGSCSNLDAATGCCMSATEPACGTYIWTGSPERYMYKCFESASIVSILDVPQFVVDASRFSETHTTPKPTTTSSKPSNPSEAAGSDSASPADNTEGGKPDGSKSDPAVTGPTSGSTPTDSTSSSNNTPVIVGSVIGGIAGLLLLLLLLFLLHRKMKNKLGLGFTRNKKNKKHDNSTKAYHTTNLSAGAAKGRNSSGSETTTTVLQQQPQHLYHSQEQYRYLPQAQIQPQVQPQVQPQQLNLQQHQHQPPPPQYRGPVGGQQQPVSMSYTVNEGATHVPQPLYSQSTSHGNMSSNPSVLGEPSHVFVGGILPMARGSSEQQSQQHQYQQPQPQPHSTSYGSMSSNSSVSGEPPHVFVGGIIPMAHTSSEKQSQQHQYQQPQPQLQSQSQSQTQLYYQQPQQQQQGVQSQLQPVNHIHVYYAPPAQHTEHSTSVTTAFSQYSSPSPEPQMRNDIVHDALGVFAQQYEQGRTGDARPDRGPSQQTQPSREREEDDIPAYYGHSRNMSEMASTSRRKESPSRDIDAEWLAARGPGYRQSV